MEVISYKIKFVKNVKIYLILKLLLLKPVNKKILIYKIFHLDI